MFEIDVDVGGLAALLTDETFEQESLPYRIDGGDAERVTDGGVGGRSTTLTKDAFRSGEANDLLHRQKIRRVFKALDECELVSYLGGHVVG
jgi:hypothetical protein